MHTLATSYLHRPSRHAPLGGFRLLKEKMALEQEMAALKARVKQLEASHRAGAVAAVRIGALQKQLKSAKENGGEAADGSKACLIS